MKQPFFFSFHCITQPLAVKWFGVFFKFNDSKEIYTKKKKETKANCQLQYNIFSFATISVENGLKCFLKSGIFIF